MDLILDQTGVHYSTPLENFETSILNLLDKGILCTHNLPQLDKVSYTTLINFKMVQIDTSHLHNVVSGVLWVSLSVSVCHEELVYPWGSSVGVSGSVGASGEGAEREIKRCPTPGHHPSPSLRP